MGEVLTRDNLKQKLSSLREGRQVVFTNGCFDILHVGHIRYLAQAKQQGDLLVVGVNSDASVRRLKGDERPIQTQADRAEVLAALAAVDFVTIFDEETPLQLIQALQPDVLVKGGDWPVEKIVGSDVVLAKGGQVKSLQFVNGKSTTSLVQKIRTL